MVSHSLPEAFLQNLPSNLHSARKKTKYMDSWNDTFICCPGCSRLYNREECFNRLNGKTEGKRCTFVKFSFHPQPRHRKPCSQSLMIMKEVKYGTKIHLYPRAVYCYKSIIDSLQELLQRPGFLSKCELWRTRPTQTGVYSDVYDGSVWAEFIKYDNRDFLSLPGIPNKHWLVQPV